jgi:hypothetical protein
MSTSLTQPLKPQILEPALPHFRLPCGCKVQQFSHHSIKVVYCQRHQNFVFSPRHNGSDVFYFVTEENKP